MKPYRLILSNFGSHIHSDIRFEEDESLIGVIGRWANSMKKSNGSGKSTFVDAILYALYNKSRVSGSSDNITELIREGQTSMSVMYEFGYNNQKISIEKEASISSSGKLKNKFRVWVNGEKKSETPNEGKEALQQVYDIEYEVFLSTAFFAQGKADEFINATSSEKQEYLRKIDKEVAVFEKAKILVAVDIKEKTNFVFEMAGKIAYLEEEDKKLNLVELNKEKEVGLASLVQVDRELTSLEEKQRVHLLNKANSDRRMSLLNVIGDSKNRVWNYNSKLQNLDDDIKNKVDSIKNLKKEMNPEIESFNMDEYKKLEEDYHKSEKDFLKAKSEVENYEIYVIPEVESLKRKIEQIGSTSLCMYCGNKLKEEYKSKQIKEAEAKLVELEDVAFYASTKENLQAIQTVVDNLRNKMLGQKAFVNDYTKYHTNKSVIESMNETLQRFWLDRKDITKEVDSIEEEIKKYDAEFGQISVDSEAEDQSEAILLTKDKQSAINEELLKITGKIDSKAGLKENINKLELQKDGLTTEISKLNKIEEGFGKNGIPYLITQNTLQVIEDHANNILQEIGTGMEVEFTTQKETKKGSINDEINLIIKMGGVERNYKTYSGGEKTLINFAVRMGISIYLTNKNQNSIEMVILDEVFSSLDEENRHKIFGMLNILKSRFNKIIAISHTSIKDIFPSLIEFERNEEGTVVI